jgi:hypothetical protein
MHTVELFDQLVGISERLGYQVRHEYLAGVGGGRCEVSGKKWIFIDLALNAAEQLEQIVEALLEDPAIHSLALPDEVAQLVADRKAA